MEFRMNGEASFEAKFAQMASATLAERAPSLQEEHVGFQLIDKNDEDTKAVGVSAYVINDLFAYIPVFFINGELKGMELLYVFQRDVFVPADDSWISMLKQEGLNSLGKPTDSNESRNPTDFFYAPEDVMTPEYEGRFNYKTATAKVCLDLKRAFDKFANDRNSRIKLDELKAMTSIPVVEGGFTGLVKEALSTVDLLEQIPQMDKQAQEAFIYTVLKNPDFANAMFNHYSTDEVHKLLKTAADEVVKEGDKDVDEVTFMTSNATGDMTVIPDKEKKLLIENGIYVKDTRTNFSKVYQDEIDTSVFQNPTEPNIYDVMMYDGSTERYLILFPNNLVDGSRYTRQWDHQNADREVALIPMTGNKKYHCCKARDVWCKISAGVTSTQQAILQKGQDANLRNMGRLRKQDLKDWEKVFGGKVLLVQSPGCVFQTEFCSDDTVKGEILLRRTAGDPYVDRNYWRDNPVKDLCSHFVGSEGSLNVYDYNMIIPEGTKIYTQERDKTLKLGAPKVVGLRFAKEASSVGMSALSLHVVGERVTIGFKGETSAPLHKHAAIKYLTMEHKIEGGQSINLIKEASEAKHGRKIFRVIHAADANIFKQADSINNMADYGTSVNPPFNGGPRGRRENAVTTKTHTSSGRALSGPVDASNQPIMPQEVIDRATRASQAGITEVFNVEVMKGLIDVADLNQLKKGYLAKMVKGMDATGRILFLYYWHQEKFEETYGMNDTQKLENTLRSVFQSMGDLILFLREKSTYNDNFSENLFGNLSEDIGAAASIGGI
jgi:hypothetical protein